MRDLERELREYQDIPPESWRPKPGDALVGKILRYEQVEGQYGPCWTVVVEVEPTEAHGGYLVAVWLSHKVLLEKFKALRLKVGERIGIRP